MNPIILFHKYIFAVRQIKLENSTILDSAEENRQNELV
jgi:hypothetical protein